MANYPQNANGQATMANSQPMAIASDQSALSISGSQPAVATSSWTSATSLNTANTITVTNLNTVSVGVVTTSTFTGGILTFEVSPDNTNWFPISMARIDSYTVESSYTLVATTVRAWSTSTDGFTNFRVRLSSVITGTGTASILITAQAFAIEPVVVVGQSNASLLNATVALPAEGFVSTNNSSVSTLTSGSVFTGTADDITIYSSVTIYVFSNVASATDGLSIQQSSDGTNWDITDVYTVPAATGKTYGVQTTAKFLRIVYTNGGTNQASFRLQTICHKNVARTSSVRTQDARSNENDFEESSSYLSGYNGTSWDRLRTTITNGLQVDVTRLQGTVITSIDPATSGGLSTFHLVSAASTNATNIKASAGQVYGWYIFNSSPSPRKVAFHNTAGTPTAGASIFYSLVIPPTAGANVEFSNGIAFGTGIAITTVTDLTDAGTTAVSLNDLIINIFYK